MVHILHEHPLGYTLVKTEDADKLLVKNILATPNVYAAFKNAFSHVGSLFYTDSEEAQQEIAMASEGEISRRLKEFLEINSVSYVAADKIYFQALKSIGVRLAEEETSAELLRIVKKFSSKIIDAEETQVRRSETSLAHSISRKKIKYDSRREDASVMQCVSLVDELDIDINDYCMRIKEMYSWHFPELSEVCPDQEAYLQAVLTVGEREKMDREEVAKLERGGEILERAKTTIGGDLAKEDIENIKELAEIVVEKILIRKKAAEHLQEKMQGVAPNLSALVGNTVGARLILKAGGLGKLALCPSSTIQVLGAEKSLFRAKKTKSNTPKYGLIFSSSFVNKSSPKMRGRVCRYLSSKCAIASRIDCYEEKVTDKYGVAMRTMVEERAKGKSMQKMPTDKILGDIADQLENAGA